MTEAEQIREKGYISGYMDGIRDGTLHALEMMRGQSNEEPPGKEKVADVQTGQEGLSNSIQRLRSMYEHSGRR